MRSDLSHYTQQTELEGKTYTFELEWIERDQFWMLHIGDESGQPLVCGIRLVEDWPLLRRDVGVLRRGQLMALDAGESSPLATNLSRSRKFVYLESPLG